MINVETWDESTQGPLSEKTLTLLLEKKGYQVCKYVYPPGTFFPDHSHAVDKIDAVLVGQFEMNMQGCPLHGIFFYLAQSLRLCGR